MTADSLQPSDEHATVAGADSPYITDAPISDPLDDRFGREPFAQRIASTLAAQRDPASIVAGLYGQWGDGKTSVLNLVELRLRASESVIPVRFNPWQFGDDTLVIRGFFEKLADALDANPLPGKERVGNLLKRYGSLLRPVPIGGDLLSAVAGVVGDSLSTEHLESLRSRIESLLVEQNKRIIVLMDDIDRLDKEEIQTVFRLIKVAADFKHTGYLLAFDQEVVSASLAERYPTGGPQGANFLEKIIQLPLHLPPISFDALQKLTFDAVQIALDQAEVELTQEDAARFVTTFARSTASRLNTPRRAKRYGNAVMFSLPMIAEEVNPIDLLLIEAVRVFYPELYEWIRDHQDDVLRTSFLGPLGKEAEETTKQAFEAITQDYSASDTNGARSILNELFPRTESLWENKGWPTEWDKTWSDQKRICSTLYFRRYFTYGVPQGDVRDVDLGRLISLIDDPDPILDEAESLIDQMLDDGSADTLVTKLTGLIDGASPTATKNLVILLTSRGRFFSDRAVFLGLSTVERAGILVARAIKRLDLADRLPLAIATVQAGEPLRFAIEIFRWCRVGQDDEVSILTESDSNIVGGVLAKRIANFWMDPNPFALLGKRYCSVTSSLVDARGA